jgi:hypothetical protein
VVGDLDVLEGTPLMPQALPGFLQARDGAVWLSIKLQPRASSNEIGEVVGNELKIRVTAPPVDSAANEALVRLLAEVLGCPRSAVELVRGHASRRKVVAVYGVEAAEVLARLAKRDASIARRFCLR